MCAMMGTMISWIYVLYAIIPVLLARLQLISTALRAQQVHSAPMMPLSKPALAMLGM